MSILSKKNLAIFWGLIVLLALAYIDLVTGYDLGFFVFYFIPISIIAWYAGRPFAIIISLLAAIAWLLIDKISGRTYSHWSFPYWNAFVRWTSFVILAIAISQIRAMLEKEQKLKQDLALALEKLKQYVAIAKRVAEGDLSAMLPSIDKKEVDQLDETFNFMVNRLAEQKNLENRLFKLERQAIMAETASHLAHEIRNPLNLIMLTTHHIGKQFVPKDEMSRKKFDELILSLKLEVEQLSKVVSDFMAIGKPSEINKTKFALIEVINQVKILTKQQFKAKSISLNIRCEEQIEIFADIEQLRLVFLNLLVNAIAEVPNNGKIYIECESMDLTKEIKVLVYDNGPGIQNSDLEKIFEPYFTRKSDGTGLGLALVKRIVDIHNGTISVRNLNDGGACFEILLPREDENCQ